MRRNYGGRAAIAVLGLMTSALAAPALALEPPAAPETDSASALTEVVVTARRREERVQDVPIAAQAFGGEALQRYGLDTAADLTRLVPSLGFSGSFETIPKITVRGVGTNEFTANVNPAVGLYVDDVYQGLGAGQNFQLFDVQRVEVLRGPQGTLFGKNSTGGAVQYFTADPTDVLEGRVEGGIGRYGRYDAEAMLNVPLGDKAALRVSGLAQTRGGYWRNSLLATKDGDIDRWALRAKLRIDPTEEISMVFKLAHGDADDDLRRSRQVGRLPSGADLTGYVARRQFWEGDSNLRTYDRVETTNASARISVDLGSATLVSITGYDEANRQSLEDPDEGPYQLLQTLYPSRGKAFSQELRLAGAAERLTYVAGVFYGRERQRNGVGLRLFDCFADRTCNVPTNAPDLREIATAFGVPLDGLSDADIVAGLPAALNDALAGLASTYDFNYRQTANTYAAFTEATYAITDAFNLTAGLRYTREKRGFVGRSAVTGAGVLGPGFGFGGIPAADDAKSWNDLSGRVIVDYKPVSGVMLYASASRGFRAGNYNGAAYSDLALVLPPVDPENVWSYETGLKSQLFERRLTLNAAAFYLDFNDKQEFILLNAQTVLRNATSARTYGLEADVTWAPASRWLLTGGVSLLDAKYGKFVSDLGDFSGNRLPSAPKVSANSSLTYTTPLAGGRDLLGYAAIDVQYRSKVYYQANNDPVAADDPHTTVDLRAGVFTADKRIQVSAQVRNLLNSKAIVDSNDLGAPLFLTILTENMPRTWGLTLAYSF